VVSDHVTFDVFAASVEPGIVVDAPLRPWCPKVEWYLQGNLQEGVLEISKSYGI
jgi:hypothetical protein